MWILIRLVALAVLAVLVVLLATDGTWLLAAAEAVGALDGVGVPAPGRAVAAPSIAVRGGLAAGALLALAPASRRVTGQVVTLLHELGHTVVAAACGARPAGIVLRHDASGHATARWRGHPTPLRRLGLAATAFAGLPAPAVLAAAGAQLLLLWGPRAVLWSIAVAGAVVALLARSPWSLLVAVAFSGAAVVTLRDAAEPWATAGVVALLAATALEATRHGLGMLARELAEGDDARAVGRYLVVPPPRVVQLAQIVATTFAGLATVWLLLSVAR